MNIYDGLFQSVVGVSRNSANKLTSMYQITYVLFMHSLMFYDVTSDDVVAVSYDVSYNNGRTIEEQEMYE